jgi:hypothetical protein
VRTLLDYAREIANHTRNSVEVLQNAHALVKSKG